MAVSYCININKTSSDLSPQFIEPNKVQMRHGRLIHNLQDCPGWSWEVLSSNGRSLESVVFLCRSVSAIAHLNVKKRIIVNLIYTAWKEICQYIRDRPFNLKGRGEVMVFCFVQNFFFSENTRVRIIFFVAQSANFFPEINIRLYDKNSVSDYFFFLLQN
jgi:hypothetical protein